ncbi:aminofutalosine synthase MqnE [Anaeroselena agilis]|uniref:Aminodeoxyfutalosine synthase n=1 Tax=Anaeroselena agilis TaxID=3063788 RepID=A0ABU3NTL7_9FIRM|nr:aminofutalosine synthase MqnE [Selenomonadales bacterium 4137-cl]
MTPFAEAAAAKLSRGGRLDPDEALALYEHNDLLLLAALARAAKERQSGRDVYFNVNRHINLTNICAARCPLCAFGRGRDDAGAYVMDREEVVAVARRAADESPDLSEIHMVSALHPDKPFAYYLDIVAAVRATLPGIHIKAFTPVEICHFAAVSGLPIDEVLRALKAAGLGSLPGGGAEVLDDAIRGVICPRKASSAQWTEVVKAAHRLGIPTNASLLYGHIETPRQRIEHLCKLRAIQDETGGFQAFVAFPFHPDNTGLPQLARVGAWEDLKMVAIARLVLDNFAHIKAFWMMLTLPVAQLALAFGADDLDGTVAEEKIIHAAGAKTGTSIAREDIVAIIREAGYVAVERDTFYNSRRVWGTSDNG